MLPGFHSSHKRSMLELQDVQGNLELLTATEQGIYLLQDSSISQGCAQKINGLPFQLPLYLEQKFE